MFVYKLTRAIEADVERIEELRSWRDSCGPESIGWQGRLRRELEAKAVTGSTSIEGVPVTVAEVVHILAGESPRSVKPRDAELVRGYREAMRHAFARADSADFAWNAELLLALHGMVMAPTRDVWPGRFREAPIFVANNRTGELVYEAPSAERIPRLIGRLCDEAMTIEESAPVVAALVHAEIARIHPFRDGNGRVARIAASLAMYRGGYCATEFTTLEEWWGSHIDEYFSTLAALGPVYDLSADLTPFVAMHVRAQRVQIEARALSNEVEREVWTALANIAEADLAMPSRAADVLYDAFFGRKVTNRYYRRIGDVSPATAANDLGRMQSAGLLAARGAGPARTYAGTPQLLARVAEEAGIGESLRLESGGPLEAQRTVILQGLTDRVQERDRLRPA